MTFRNTKVAAFLERRVAELPTPVYLYLAPKLLGLVNSKRANCPVRFRQLADSLMVANDPWLGPLAFYEKTRLKFYSWSDGVAHRLDDIQRKYEHGDVVIEAGDVVVDVGANIGEFSIAATRKAAVALAFEPDPLVYRCLELNAKQFGKLRSFASALSDKAGEMTFYHACSTADSSLVEPVVPYTTSRIKTVALDDLFPTLDIPRIDFFKVEAEGWEPEVLQGAQETLKHRVRKVAVDAGPERKGQSTRGEVEAILVSHGFQVAARGDMVYGIK